MLEEGVNVIRGKVAEVVPARNNNSNGDHLLIRCEDTLLGRFREIPVDMVILCNALEAHRDTAELARTLSLSRSPDGFFLERHPKLDPVGTTTDGIYLAGCCQGPKDIPDTVAQAQASAAQVLALIARGETKIDPIRASIDPMYCSGCKTCLDLCPYGAITFEPEHAVAVVNDALCKGCGTCVAACPASAISGAGFTDEQVMAELEGLLAGEHEGPRIVAFLCNWCSYTGADLAGISRIPWSSDVDIVRVMCSGRMDPTLIVQAFRLGADGVIVSGCHPGDCHYQQGNYKALRRVRFLKRLLADFGIDPERLRLVWVSASEGEEWAAIANEMTAKIRALGEMTQETAS